ncbi:MAG: hypothetical protein ABL962_17045, partial [Fimbriimonadaceae bacterium]
MAHKSPFTEEIYQEWDQLVLEKGRKLSLAERTLRWRKLYERTCSNGTWTVPCGDASLVASLGANLSLESGDYELGREVCQSYLQLEPIDEVSSAQITGYYGVCTILAGDEEVGCLILSNLLTVNSQIRSSILLLLSGLLYEQGHQNAASKLQRELVGLLLSKYPGNKRRSQSALRSSTNGQLDELLMD